MSKSFFIMDTPNNCKECDVYICYRQYAGDAGDSFCGITKQDANFQKRPEDCPLKPVPEQKEKGSVLASAIKNKCFNGSAENRAYFNGKECGYNACIAEILQGHTDKND